MRISVADQKMYVFRQSAPIAIYDVSTSKFGVGDGRGSYRTPLGRMEVAKKIGANAPLGMKFKNRRPTGEIVRVDAPGRDPIVTRILWLRGLEPQNRLAYDRAIYIHGTADEHDVGRPCSYGCIRMRSHDVMQLFNMIGVGAQVEVVPGSLLSTMPKMDDVPKPGNAATVEDTPNANGTKRKAHATKADHAVSR